MKTLKLIPVLILLLASTAMGQTYEDRHWAWGYNQEFPPVLHWNVRVNINGDVTLVTTTTPEQKLDVPIDETTESMSISVQGVNSTGSGPWSEWSDVWTTAGIPGEADTPYLEIIIIGAAFGVLLLLAVLFGRKENE